jgi:hypothetical protein
MTQFAKSKRMRFSDRSIWPDFYFSVEGKELVDNVLGIINEK